MSGTRSGDIAWRERGHFLSHGTKRLRLLWERGFLRLNSSKQAKQSNEALAARSLGFGCTACIPRLLWGRKSKKPLIDLRVVSTADTQRERKTES